MAKQTANTDQTPEAPAQVPFTWPLETKDGVIQYTPKGVAKPDLRKKTVYNLASEMRNGDATRRDEILRELIRVTTPAKQGRGTTAIDPDVMLKAIDQTPAFGKFTQYAGLLGAAYFQILKDSGRTPLYPNPLTIVSWSLATGRTLRVQPSESLVKAAKAS